MRGCVCSHLDERERRLRPDAFDGIGVVAAAENAQVDELVVGEKSERIVPVWYIYRKNGVWHMGNMGCDIWGIWGGGVTCLLVGDVHPRESALVVHLHHRHLRGGGGEVRG